VVGRYQVDDAVAQSFPETQLMPLLPNRRIDADDRTVILVSALVEQEIMRAGLAGDVDPARLCLAQGAQLIGRGDMQDVDTRACPFREHGGARDRLDGDNGRPRGQVGEGVVTSRCLQPLLPPSHDGGGLGMKCNPQATLGDDLEAFEHGTRRGRGEIAEGIAHEAFEARNAPSISASS
jgi:hypothetical protein